MTEVSAGVPDVAQTPGNPDVPEAGQLVRVRVSSGWSAPSATAASRPANSPARLRPAGLPGIAGDATLTEAP